VEAAITMNELGRLYFRLGMNEKTLFMWKKSLEIREKVQVVPHDIGFLFFFFLSVFFQKNQPMNKLLKQLRLTILP